MTAARRVAKYTDEQLLHARLVFRTNRHEYLQLRPGMQAEAGSDLAHLFAPPDAEDDLRRCVTDLLLNLGRETLRTRQRATQP